MLPDPGTANALTAQWWVAAGVLLIFTITGGVIVSVVRGAMQQAKDSERGQNTRLAGLEAEIREQELRGLQRDNAQRERLHELELKMAECQANHCVVQGHLVDQETHHGDMLRMEKKLEDMEQRVIEAIAEVHRRVDEALVKRIGEKV